MFGLSISMNNLEFEQYGEDFKKLMENQCS